MKTLQKQIFPNGEDRSTCLQEDSHASRSALQGSEKERKITVTSGRKCSEQYGRYDQLGSLVKMLLESSRWFSPARRLKWEIKALCSEKVTEKEYCTDKNMSPKQFAETLNVKDIQSSRLLFRLVPSEHRTGETGCGLLPTPMSTEVRHQKRVQELKAAGGNTFHSRANGETRPNGLMDFIEFHMMLPTPTAQDFKKRGPNSKQQGLPDVFRGILPTPRANKVNGVNLNSSQMANRNKGNLEEAVAKIIQNSPCECGKTSQLNPLFVAEMMGFPPDWTVLPFLNGDKNP